MKNYYTDYEIEFYINSIEDLIDKYNEKIRMLNNLKNEFFEELKSRGVD